MGSGSSQAAPVPAALAAYGAARRFLGIGQAESALVIAIPAFEAVLADLQMRHGFTTAPGLPAHVTVVYPFLPRRQLAGAMPRLLELGASIDSFEFTLARVGRFPGVVYAAPEPAEPFVRLVEGAVQRFPHHPPYGGRYPDIVPHCTVFEGPEPDGLAADLAARLPIAAIADKLTVLGRSRGIWRPIASIPLTR